MFVLPLSDPLWRKLDDAHRDRDIPAVLADLAAAWDPKTAEELFWDDLCHQDSCYGATYAAVPHLLAIAEAAADQSAASEIAMFLGHVASVAFQPGHGCGDEAENSVPQGLPDTLEGWDRKLDTYRSLAEYARKDLADPAFPPKLDAVPSAETWAFIKSKLPNMPDIEDLEPMRPLTRASRQADLDRYLELLARPPVDETDLKVIGKIRQAFFDALDPIAALSAGIAETDEDPQMRGSMIEGMAAGLGAPKLAQLFSFGTDGAFACANCGWQHSYLIFGDRMACYASPVGPEVVARIVRTDEPSMLDYQDGAPNRADGFVRPAEDLTVHPVALRISELATKLDDQKSLRQLHLFAGTYRCGKCGVESSLT